MTKISRAYLVDVVLLLAIGIFFSFFHLSKLYGFEFDQERDFNIVKGIVVEHKFTLIGPRVVSSAGFYLGPWYYYLQVPFFVAMKGDPIYGAVFTAFTSVAICLLIYFVLRRHTTSRLVPFLAAILWVGSANRSNWNVAFVPFFFLLFLHLYWELEKKKRSLYLFLLTLVLALSFNFHPQMIFLTPVWLYAAYRYFRSQKKLSPNEVGLTILAFLIPFAPLVVFDLRHDFVNTNAALNFLGSSSLMNAAVPFFRFGYSLRQFSTSLAFIYPGFQHNLVLTSVFLAAALVFVLYQSKYLFLFLITFLSVVVLGFYRELTWPEYYHYLSGFALFTLAVLALSRIKFGKLFLLTLTLFVVWVNYKTLITYINPGSYYYKKSMILWMLTKNKPFELLNIENDFKYGEGLGFLPIREFYEKKSGEYNPNLKFYVSYADSPKHNQTKEAFGMYAISLIGAK